MSIKRLFTYLFFISALVWSPCYGADTSKPHPIVPATWRFFPAPAGPTSITMQASRCYDIGDPNTPPVWYYYQCTTAGHTDINSGWIQGDSNAAYDANTIWTVTGLDPNTSYSFKYRARDSADPCNMTNWSGAKSAKTDKATTPALLRLDFNAETDSNAINNRPGFTPFTLSDNGSTIGGITVDLAANISEKRNPDPCGQWFSMLGDANQEYYQRAGETLYQDMIFGIVPNGIKVTLWGLGVNQDCNLTLFAYDDKSTSEGNRVAHWFSNGTPIFDTNFIGGLSTSLRNENDYPNDIYKWAYSKRVTADAFGRIVLTSTQAGTAQPFSFMNALIVEPNASVTYVQTPYATPPQQPLDGAEDVNVDTVLSWTQGAYAEKHDVYFGTNFADVNTASRGNPLGVLVSLNHSTTTYDPPEFLDFGTTYYWRIDEVNSAPDYTIFKGLVWSFKTYELVLIACNPVPLDGAEGVLADVNLTWEKGEYAEKHDVYFGTDFNDVNNADRSYPLGVLVSENQSATTYDPPESLDPYTTYYWRIDEVNAAPDYTIFKGEVWSFRTKQHFAGGPYFGQTPPGLTAEVFAPGLISLPARNESKVVFSPDGNECFIRADTLLYTKQENGHWLEPVPADFLGNRTNVEPFITTDGQKLFFAGYYVAYAADIYVSTKVGGQWSAPSYLPYPISTDAEDWHPTLTSDGTLYFCSSRNSPVGGFNIYRSRPVDGQYTQVEQLDSTINSQYGAWDPFIAPDESYMIFSTSRPDGYGSTDQHISYLQEDGSWTYPQNLGPAVNTSGNEYGSYISYDGKYYFFNRPSGDVYWVDARAIFPAYDFTRDGKVDFNDLDKLVAHWLTDESSVDIAPPEEPDGIVNFLDFAVFAQHWLEVLY